VRARASSCRAALALSSTLALAAPESLLPGQYDNPAPAPRRAPRPAPRGSGAVAPARRRSIQPLPGAAAAAPAGPVALPPNFPSLEELEAMDDEEIDELLGLKPKFDIPPAARRAVRQVGVIGADEAAFAPACSTSSHRADPRRVAPPTAVRWSRAGAHPAAAGAGESDGRRRAA
jgi:hypothetical protein